MYSSNKNYPESEFVFSVKDYLSYLNEVFRLHKLVTVTGELGVVKNHSSGTYFTLKDTADTANLECYVNPQHAKNIGFLLEEGMTVEVIGRPLVFARKGVFKFSCFEIRPIGEGSLKKVYEFLKKQLFEEGLFDRKRPLPESLKKIAVITSVQGSVIHDFEKNLKPMGLKVDIFHSSVEGIRAEPELLASLKVISQNSDEYDLCVLIRGGGSLEDLAAFNSEKVIRAVFALPIPSLVGIGHETDVPLINFVADKAVSTPTAVAWELNQIFLGSIQELSHLAFGISSAFESSLDKTQENLNGTYQSLVLYLLELKKQISGYRKKITDYLGNSQSFISTARLVSWAHASRLSEKYSRLLERTRYSVDDYHRCVSASNPNFLLEKGWYKLLDTQESPISDPGALKDGQEIQIQYKNGKILAKILKNIKTL